MKPEQQRTTIAEACGWKHYHEDLWVSPNVTDFSELDCEQLPDYLNDLNAMHEAEKVLTWKNQSDYAALLGRSYDGSFHHVTATAAQRAEAFLRTLNLWTND
jgi:predicted phosphoadenosine phosphosulfate sulfurtransferase